MGAVVIIGAGGFIGQHLLNHFKQNAIPLFKGDIDLFSFTEIEKFLKEYISN